jgi:pilus assembly protein Flp/PilA
MGAPARFEPIRDAAGRFAAYSDAARSALSRFFGDRSGTTSIEYAIIASMISILIVAGLTSIGTQVRGFFQSVLTGL